MLEIGEILCSSGKDFQRDQVRYGGNRHKHAWQHLDPIGLRHNLGFDARTGEKQVQERARAAPDRTHEARCRQPTHILLLHHHAERIAPHLQPVYQRIGFLVAGYGNCEIDALGEPRLCAEGNREAADDGPACADGVEISCGVGVEGLDWFYLGYR
jgi:hypothetical protein